MVNKKLQKAKLRCSLSFPFFGYLLLHIEIKIEPELQSEINTSHNSIYVSESFISSQTTEGLSIYLAHCALHIALMHNVRKKARHAHLWNIACDIVVNNILREFNISPPAKTVDNSLYNQLSAEEVYNLLNTKAHSSPFITPDCLALNLDEHIADLSNLDNENTHTQQDAEQWNQAFSMLTSMETSKNIFEQAKSIGHISKTLRRETSELSSPQLSWQRLLARYTQEIANDYSGLDYSLINHGIYTERLDSIALFLYVLIDTSGSISRPELSAFIAELKSILSMTEGVKIKLYYCDVKLSGPFELHDINNIPQPKGGGGTNFDDFFELFRGKPRHYAQQYSTIIFTDGYVDLPKEQPIDSLIWVLTKSSSMINKLPYGDVISMGWG